MSTDVFGAQANDRDQGLPGIYAPMSGPWGTSTYALGNNVLRVSRVMPSRPMKIISISIAVTTAAGSDDAIDLAIFDVNGNRLGSSGALTSKVNALGAPAFPLTAPVRLEPGVNYYVGIASPPPGTTAASIHAMGMGVGGAAAILFGSTPGLYEMTSLSQAPPIPASVIFPANNGGVTVAPVFGLREQ